MEYSPLCEAFFARALLWLASMLGAVVASRSLLVFRTRSRHTLDFKPAAIFDLPLLEFAALEPAATLTPASEDAQCTWVDGISEAALMRSAAACILVQAAYRVIGFGTSVEAAAVAAARREEEAVQGRLRVVDLARPDLLRNEAARPGRVPPSWRSKPEAAAAAAVAAAAAAAVAAAAAAVVAAAAAAVGRRRRGAHLAAVRGSRRVCMRQAVQWTRGRRRRA